MLEAAGSRPASLQRQARGARPGGPQLLWRSL